jgi:hypothetical protein
MRESEKARQLIQQGFLYGTKTSKGKNAIVGEVNKI